jgi:hypothetical protein
MNVRYAVLWDLDDPNPEHNAIPCGLAIDRGDHVQVGLIGGEENWGIKDRFDETFQELQPDGRVLEVKPGDYGYFGQVLYSLHRTFAITIPLDSGAHAENMAKA